MDNEVQTRTYTLMMLIVLELSSWIKLKDFGMRSKWRILPKQFGDYKGRKILKSHYKFGPANDNDLR